MQKFTVLMAMAVFLAATLFMAVPGFAQTQGGQGGLSERLHSGHRSWLRRRSRLLCQPQGSDRVPVWVRVRLRLLLPE